MDNFINVNYYVIFKIYFDSGDIKFDGMTETFDEVKQILKSECKDNSAFYIVKTYSTLLGLQYENLFIKDMIDKFEINDKEEN